MIILCAGCVLILLPLTLASYGSNRWNSASTITMLVIGFCLLVAFFFYEKYASKPFLPWHLLINPTVLGSCLLIALLYTSVYCWDLYFNAYLQVVFGLSVSNAGYIANIFQLGTVFWGMITGIIIRWIGRYKLLNFWAFKDLCSFGPEIICADILNEVFLLHATTNEADDGLEYVIRAYGL